MNEDEFAVPNLNRNTVRKRDICMAAWAKVAHHTKIGGRFPRLWSAPTSPESVDLLYVYCRSSSET
jgi:hypothetical protein